MDLKIADNFSLPLEFVTGTEAILGRKGSGKSHTASVMAEELLEAGQQVVVIDPTDSWWGLRAAGETATGLPRAGTFTGYPIAVLGGEHADLPLEATQGKEVAAALAQSGASAILSVGEFDSNAAACRFVADFLNELFRLKGKHGGPVKLIIDEADAFAPQRPQGEEMKALGAMQKIIRRGRSRGIGCLMITQRPQEMAKGCLSQADMLVLMRLSHPKDINAVDEWVRVQADEKEADAVMSALPALPIGAGYLWHPGQGLLTRVTFRRRRTFDSGATPKANEVRAKPGEFRPVDIKALGASMAAAAEEAKANDPAELRKALETLEYNCALVFEHVTGGAISKPYTDPKAIQAVHDDHVNKLIDEAVAEAKQSTGNTEATESARAEAHAQGVRAMAGRIKQRLTGRLADLAEEFARIESGELWPQEAQPGEQKLGGLHPMQEALLEKRGPYKFVPTGISAGKSRLGRDADFAESARAHDDNTGRSSVARGEFSGIIIDEVDHQTHNPKPRDTSTKLRNRILTVLAQWPEGKSKRSLAVTVGVAHSGGYFNNTLGAMRSEGLITVGEPVYITPSGKKVIGAVPPRPRGRMAFDYWRDQLGGIYSEILGFLLGGGLHKASLAARCGKAENGGYFNNALGKLRTLGLIEGKAELKLAAELR